jgi:hypothetical protein
MTECTTVPREPTWRPRAAQALSSPSTRTLRRP